MEQNDIVERYAIDIFTEAIPEGEDRAQAHIFIGFAQNLETLSNDEIFNEYPELLDCIVSNDPNANQTAKSYINLLRRHSKQVRDVMRAKVVHYADRLYEASLPDSSLVRLVASGQLLENHVEILAKKVENILSNGLPKIFQSRAPKNEHEVQDASEALFKAASENLFRELPLLPFAGISTKPDFSKLDKSKYYIEMKYLKSRQRLNSAITEITSRALIYANQGAFAHFIIYDPLHLILDLPAMQHDIDINGKIRIGVIR